GEARMLEYVPPPVDPVRERLHAPRASFHVRIGPALIVSLDSNHPLTLGSTGRAFLEAALADRGDARFVFVAMHQGLLSSGPHGGVAGAEDLLPLIAEHHVTAVLSGHDHIYERIVRDGTTFLISGGGGAPLYFKAKSERGSVAFAATYNWVGI